MGEWSRYCTIPGNVKNIFGRTNNFIMVMPAKIVAANLRKSRLCVPSRATAILIQSKLSELMHEAD
jgi:hypothetical protein